MDPDKFSAPPPHDNMRIFEATASTCFCRFPLRDIYSRILPNENREMIANDGFYYYYGETGAGALGFYGAQMTFALFQWSVIS